METMSFFYMDPMAMTRNMFPAHRSSPIPTLYDFYTMYSDNISEYLMGDYGVLNKLEVERSVLSFEDIKIGDTKIGLKSFSDGTIRPMYGFYPPSKFETPLRGDPQQEYMKTLFGAMSKANVIVLGSSFIKTEVSGIPRQYLQVGASSVITPRFVVDAISNGVPHKSVLVVLIGYQTIFFAREMFNGIPEDIDVNIIFSENICSHVTPVSIQSLQNILLNTGTGNYGDKILGLLCEYLSLDEVRMRRHVSNQGVTFGLHPSSSPYTLKRLHERVKLEDAGTGDDMEQKAERIILEGYRWSQILNWTRPKGTVFPEAYNEITNPYRNIA